MTLVTSDVVCAPAYSSGKSNIYKTSSLPRLHSGFRCKASPSGVWMSKPPRPPCWHDFLSRSQRAAAASVAEFTDLGHVIKAAEASSDPGGSSHGVGGPGENRSKTRYHRNSHKQSKKPKHTLHRTQSEFSIDQCDLPSMEQMTRTLADAKPRELGLRRRTLDTRLYIDENKRRCERWLAGVHASHPLDDIAFAQGTGVELEIPEETWEDLAIEKFQKAVPPHNSSASSSDTDEGEPRARRLTTSSSPAALGLSHLLIKKPQIHITPPTDPHVPTEVFDDSSFVKESRNMQPSMTSQSNRGTQTMGDNRLSSFPEDSSSPQIVKSMEIDHVDISPSEIGMKKLLTS